jgi:hypothetical protein
MTDKRLYPEVVTELDEHLERLAAAMWRAHNPAQSVFDCDQQTKQHYRNLALEWFYET